MRWIATSTTDYDSFGGSYDFVLSHVGDASIESRVWCAPVVVDADGDPLDSPEECTIERVVGHLETQVLNADPAGNSVTWSGMFHERLHLGILDMSTGLPVVPPVSLAEANEAEESLLWERKRIVAGQTGTTITAMRCNPITAGSQYGGIGANPYHSTIDCRVNRRLTTGTALIYSTYISVTSGAWNAGARCESYRGVRVLVKNIR